VVGLILGVSIVTVAGVVVGLTWSPAKRPARPTHEPASRGATPADAAGEFHSDGDFFRYPPKWTRIRQTEPAQRIGNSPSTYETVGIGPDGFIGLSTSDLGLEVDPLDPDAENQITDAVKRMVRKARARFTGPIQTTLGGQTAYRFGLLDVAIGGGRTADGILVVTTRGRIEYDLSCQFTKAREREIVPVCEEIIRTLRFT
jgi:hypothetical protein